MQDSDGGRKHRINVYRDAACSGGVVVVALGFLVTSGLEAFCKGLERSTQLFIMNLACTVTGVRYTRYRYPVTVSGVGNRYSNLGKFLRLEAVPLRGPVRATVAWGRIVLQGSSAPCSCARPRAPGGYCTIVVHKNALEQFGRRALLKNVDL